MRAWSTHTDITPNIIYAHIIHVCSCGMVFKNFSWWDFKIYDQTVVVGGKWFLLIRKCLWTYKYEREERLRAIMRVCSLKNLTREKNLLKEKKRSFQKFFCVRILLQLIFDINCLGAAKFPNILNSLLPLISNSMAVHIVVSKVIQMYFPLMIVVFVLKYIYFLLYQTFTLWLFKNYFLRRVILHFPTTSHMTTSDIFTLINPFQR